MRIVYNSHSTIGTDMNTANKANILSTWEDTFGQLFFFFLLYTITIIQYGLGKINDQYFYIIKHFY